LIDFFGITPKRFNYLFRKVEGESKYRERTINKATGKPRTIHAVSKRLRTVQRIALEKLQAEKKFQPSRHAHGFTTGKSIITNAIFHRRSKRIIKMDLKDFFPSIHFGRVRGMFMAKPFEFGEKAATIMAQLACLDDKSGILPQGGSLSPYIANMMCRRLDQRLAQVARSHRCHFTRYADDITFSTNDVSQENIEDLIKETSTVIDDENFIVNNDKTKILTPEERQVVTGIIVNDGINVNRRYVRNLRATLRNCERFGINSQIEKKVFRDDRSSRPNKNASKYHPSIDYFLRHLFGKISFYGSVVLSNGQDKANKQNPDLYKRVQTYEDILKRFLKLLKNDKAEFDSKIIKLVEKVMMKRPNLADQLSIAKQGKIKISELIKEHTEKASTKRIRKELNSIASKSKLEDFIKKMGKDDPRFFNQSPGILNKTKEEFDELLKFPKIDPKKTKRVLKAIKAGGLRELVHSKDDSNSDFLVKDCFDILNDHYYEEVIYLPINLKFEFKDWIKALNNILEEHSMEHPIDVVKDPIIAEATKKLKVNTRFGDEPTTHTILKDVIEELIGNIGIKENRVDLQIVNDLGFYTHVPSIKRSIFRVLESMSNRTPKGHKIKINVMIRTDKKIELRIFDESKNTLDDKLLDDRDFANTKLTEVIQKTNGLCEYWVEAGLQNGKRKVINMHNNRSDDELELSELKHGFAHRFIFEK
jgi:RNA-directed DNA polymerase